MKRSSLARRLVAGAAGLLLGATGALALAAPAQATQSDEPDIARLPHRELSAVHFEDTCEGTNIYIHSGDFLPTYKWTVTVDGTEYTTVEFGAGEGDALFVPVEDGTEISVDFKHSPGWQWPATWTWTEPADCEEEPQEPEQPELIGAVEVEFDCETAVVSIINDSEVEVAFSVVPSEGDPVDVSVPAGTTSEGVSFPVSVGLTIDVLVEGVSVLEDGPFEFTEEDLAACEEEEGEGGELPVTGSSTGLIALGAVALLALGGGLYLVARRRRVTFTA